MLIIGQYLPDRIALRNAVHPGGLTGLMAAQHEKYLIVLADKFLPHHLWLNGFTAE